MHNEIGFSTGVFWNTKLKPISIEAIDYSYELSSSAIEIGGSIPEHWASFASIPAEKILRFKYRSLHAPNDMTREQAEFIRTIQDKYDLHAITIHPDPNENWAMLKEVGLRVGVENMDNRKDYGRSPEAIKKIIKEYGFNWVLDVNHIYTHDKTVKLVDTFIEELGTPTHIHLSGYDETLLHTVIYDKNQEVIIKQLQVLHLSL